ncbi:uncharacterized protein LOC121865655 [Homarus americanus]|uniref:Putative Sleepless protein domain-containing protein 2 n=1 Tax=Homarus americanus TaxID=6706 RepID=A0A8J5K2X5_HOMAM|nr:uncharacterized protein LOC121865655 [Homarus americanus]KAG7169547.1 putative Sleepless protein domain-containing protein 2 [Homarus americanus]
MSQRTIVQCFLGVGVLLVFLNVVEGQVRRCYSCRSRGKLGDCKDPARFNASRLVPGVEAVPCASSWCSKIIEGKKDGEDHDLATERQCLQRSPPDSIQRCSEALVGNKKVFICFCRGDLCNSAVGVSPSLLLLLVGPAALLLHHFRLW